MTSKKSAKLDEEKLGQRLKEDAGKVDQDDAENILGRRIEFEKKLKWVPGFLSRMVNQLKLLFGLVWDYFKGGYKEVPWFSIAMAVAAIAYFLNPFDLIPDAIPVIGLVDDAFVVFLAFMAIEEDLRKYCAFKGYDSEQYFYNT